MRKKYDWLFIIDDNNLNSEFKKYCLFHKGVKSEKRLARSFVVGKHIKKWPCYEVGRTEPLEIYFSRLAQASWL